MRTVTFRRTRDVTDNGGKLSAGYDEWNVILGLEFQSQFVLTSMLSVLPMTNHLHMSQRILSLEEESEIID